MTTALLTDQEKWQAAINDPACEPFVLLAYADWLEERGEDEARAWRWFGKLGKRPKFIGRGHVPSEEFIEQWRGWNWFQHDQDDNVSHNLPLLVGLGQGGDWFNSPHPTRFAAYQAAARAMCEHYPNEIPKPVLTVKVKRDQAVQCGASTIRVRYSHGGKYLLEFVTDQDVRVLDHPNVDAKTIDV